MIELNRSKQQTAPTIKIAGLGGAGTAVLDRLLLDGFDADAAIAMNTDIQALNASVAREKIQLGRETTRGLGTGGDPELGYAAADECVDEISAAFAESQIVFLCAGLGGGTAGGAAPLVAHLARKAGALVIAFVTMPFSFEGRRRCRQAAEALDRVCAQADLVVCFENDRMSEVAAPAGGVQQAFVASDQTLSQSIRAISALVQRNGLIATGLDDLTSILRSRGARCLFGYGESDGPNRAHEALERALRCPLMNRGAMLAHARSVIIHVSGGSELNLGEVTALMDEFNRHVSDTTRIHFGLATDARLGRRICVAIISSEETPEIAAAGAAPAASRPRHEPVQPPPQPPRPRKTTPTAQPVRELFDPPEQPAPPPVEEEAPAAHDDSHDDYEGAPAVAAGFEPESEPVSKYAPQPPTAKRQSRAEQMTLVPASRGRFEKSEPTIVDGQDLDVPTFLRKNIKVK